MTAAHRAPAPQPVAASTYDHTPDGLRPRETAAERAAREQAAAQAKASAKAAPKKEG